MSEIRIDAHHHLWRYDAREFGWLDGGMQTLQRDFLPEDLEAALASANVTAAVAVQARCSLAETKFLLQCARASRGICAVVGWMPLESSDLCSVLDEFASETKLVGVREITQGQAKRFFTSEEFNAGVKGLTSREITCDLLIYENELDDAAMFVRRHPQQKFVLDHAAKPKIAEGELEPWRRKLRELARNENTWCKLSGLTTEADWRGWSMDDLRPYLDACLESFGPKRVMVGSDWPVCLVATEYAQWWSVLEEYFAEFSSTERSAVFGGTAVEFYGIDGVKA